MATLEIPPVTSAPPVRTPLRWAWLSPVAGIALGVLDLFGQVRLPYPWADLANSPAVWAVAAFAFAVMACPGRVVRGAMCGAVLLVVGVEAYEAIAVLALGNDVYVLTAPATVLWLSAGVVAGGVFGAAGATVRGARAGWRVLGRATAPSLLFGEAFRSLREADVARTQSAVVLLAVGVLMLGIGMAVSRRRLAEWGATVLVCVPLTVVAVGLYAVARIG